MPTMTKRSASEGKYRRHMSIERLKVSLMADSDIDLTSEQQRGLEKALMEDNEPLLTEQQADLLVMGDGEGTISDKLKQKFPNTHKFLDSLF
jgi:radical SAM superfamily enzyme YgiQ (UPF0313 family)